MAYLIYGVIGVIFENRLGRCGDMVLKQCVEIDRNIKMILDQ